MGIVLNYATMTFTHDNGNMDGSYLIDNDYLDQQLFK